MSYYESGNTSNLMFFPRLHVKKKTKKDMEMEGKKKKREASLGLLEKGERDCRK